MEKGCSVQMMMKMMSEGPLHKAPYFFRYTEKALLLLTIFSLCCDFVS